MHYAIRAVASDRRVVSVTLEGSSEQDVRNQLNQRELTPLTIKAKTSAVSLLKTSLNDSVDLLLLAQELVSLLRAGLSIVEALETLVEQDQSNNLKISLTRVLGHLRDGMSFSAALEVQPSIYSPLFVGIVQSAERTGQLDIALERFVDYEAKAHLIRNRLISASIYPAILLAVGGFVAAFLVIYVVPKFATVYIGSGRDAPLLSQLLMSLGIWLNSHIPHLVFAFVGTGLLLALALFRLHSKAGLGDLLHRLPWIGWRLKHVELSRLYLTLGMLISGGLTVIRAIRMSEAVVGRSTAIRLKAAAAEIETGIPISQAFMRHHLAPSVAYRLIRVGERSGQVGTLLTRCAEYYDTQVARWVDRFSRSFEPLLMVSIGLFIGVVVLLLYMPIFDLAATLQ